MNRVWLRGQTKAAKPAEKTVDASNFEGALLEFSNLRAGGPVESVLRKSGHGAVLGELDAVSHGDAAAVHVLATKAIELFADVANTSQWLVATSQRPLKGHRYG